ncbi:MAG: hypothetical protein QOI63_899 [Thermoplasmata archaeon]|nr:hypothetical protein [Thermoplasmata archaeon]
MKMVPMSRNLVVAGIFAALLLPAFGADAYHMTGGSPQTWGAQAGVSSPVDDPTGPTCAAMGGLPVVGPLLYELLCAPDGSLLGIHQGDSLFGLIVCEQADTDLGGPTPGAGGLCSMSPGFDAGPGTCTPAAGDFGRSNGNGPAYNGGACTDPHALPGVLPANVAPHWYRLEMFAQSGPAPTYAPLGPPVEFTAQINGVDCGDPATYVIYDDQLAYLTADGHVAGFPSQPPPAGSQGTYSITASPAPTSSDPQCTGFLPPDPSYVCAAPGPLASPPPYPFSPLPAADPNDLGGLVGDPGELVGDSIGVDPNAWAVGADDPTPLCPDGQLPEPIPPADEHGWQPPAFGANHPYFYGTIYDPAPAAGSRDGGGMTTTVQNPAISNAAGTHSLNEIAVIANGAGGRNIVEIGWTKSRDYGGAGDVRLFVFSWVNGAPGCYNGCGWKQYSNSIVPGKTVATGTGSYMGYVYYQGNWWAWWTNQWVGYFPGTKWSGAFAQDSQVQWFGEVYDTTMVGGSPKPATDMGTGYYATNANAAQFSTPCDVDAANWVCWIKGTPKYQTGDAPSYNVKSIGNDKYRWGGPGNANGVGINP